MRPSCELRSRNLFVSAVISVLVKMPALWKSMERWGVAKTAYLLLWFGGCLGISFFRARIFGALFAAAIIPFHSAFVANNYLVVAFGVDAVDVVVAGDAAV